MQTKHWIFFSSLFALCALLGAGIVFIGKQLPDARLPELGTSLPRMGVSDASGRSARLGEPGKPTVIVVYRHGCKYCARELGQLLRKPWNATATTLVLVKHFGRSPDADIAPSVDGLRGAGALATTLQGKDVLGKFGTLLTPATFVYDRAGHLSSVFLGEVSPQVILDATKRAANSRQSLASNGGSPGGANALAR